MLSRPKLFFLSVMAILTTLVFSQGMSLAGEARPDRMPCGDRFGNKRTVCADVAALDQILIYNRFGSFNPFGMMFALTRDLSQADVATAKHPDGSFAQLDADYCDNKDGTETGAGLLSPGNVRLKDCKRPRPMVLRVGVNDVLKVRLRNYLSDGAPGFTETFCQSKTSTSPGKKRPAIDRLAMRGLVSQGDDSQVDHGEAACTTTSLQSSPDTVEPGSADTDWPRTRGVSFAVQGLHAIAPTGEQVKQECLGLAQVMPGNFVDCYYAADREGTYFLSSKAAPAGGEGDGGSITHGLFGAVVVEPRNSKWYRSQVTRKAFDLAWPLGSSKPRHARSGSINYEAVNSQTQVPILNLVQPAGGDGKAVEIVHTDLNALVYRDGSKDCSISEHDESCLINFREFSVFFHDELKTFFTKNFEELGKFGQLAGVRDGFGINYGASGMGTMLLANRKGIGPAADCIECLYEEFFLASWANGDPALLEVFSDDPSNVHHSYLNDRIVFRNFHAGPKETHVFHLHDHQWFSGNDPNRGSYLDSQTVGPEQGFSYDIYHGGGSNYSPRDPAKKKGWWETLGAGNRNRSPGDSIFHCHLYPHFAQGMWELWRNHDVLEDGTRKLPDGQHRPGFSVSYNNEPKMVREGTIDRSTGNWKTANPSGSSKLDGTPVPAIIPLPDQALPLLPTYTADATGMPGYPFYIAARPGHRPPQAPLDLALDVKTGKHLDGGLPRHVIKSGKRKFEVSGAERLATNPGSPAWEKVAAQYVAKVLSLGNFAAHIEEADIELPGAYGSPLEQAAMGFHYNGKRAEYDANGKLNLASAATLSLADANGNPSAFKFDEGGYPTLATPKPGASTSLPAFYFINGAPPKPGAPFADPCAVASGMKFTGRKADGSPDESRVITERDDPLYSMTNDYALYNSVDGSKFVADPGMTGFRRVEASAVQLDLVTNRAGWHDPQARINVLTADSPKYKTERKVSADEKPFFFRALSGECIEFRHTNELPKELDLDDFQVKTPTDTIGQHIHLVKFDVMASDGSGNGWNYEDGTFASDEVVQRICASENPALAAQKAAYCVSTGIVKDEFKEFWKKTLGDRAGQPFQTTAQRWFADPILSSTGDSSDNLADRTMRTVFTHDHFGPSSIQQHGFYAALVIEPQRATVCVADKTEPVGKDCEQPSNNPLDVVVLENDTMTGVHRLVTTPDATGKNPRIHENYREYALAVADFATLYDPQDYESRSKIGQAGREPEGMERLLCEAQHRRNPSSLDTFCGYKLEVDGAGLKQAPEDWSPAWVAGGMAGDSQTHRPGPDMFAAGADPEIAALKERLLSHRKLAAGCDPVDSTCDRLAQPVAAPRRPESISVDHHDPYLVNYRGEPVPLRVGTHSATNSNQPCTKAKVEEWVDKSGTQWKLTKPSSECSIDAQRKDAEGDMANVFVSSVHGDPATPVIETYDGERVILRMIQGAQEVQHVFNLDGYGWTRHIDQRFSAGSRRLELSDEAKASPTAYQACVEKGRTGKPLEYKDWFDGKKSADAYWQQQEALLASCDNLDGRTTAQEIGISEHFEFQGQFRKAVAGAERAGDAQQNSTDYQFHFGSSDDIWNGAWGLLRVFTAPDALDMGKCKGGKQPDGSYGSCQVLDTIGMRLGKVARLGTSEGDNDSNKTRPAETAVSCPSQAQRSYFAVVALTAKQVWGTASYGSTLSDPDGLVLARLDAADLPTVANEDDWKKLWYGTDGSQQPSLPGLIAKIRAKYPNGPVPLTINAAAGSCVHLAVINAMQVESSGTAPYLRDLLGDALMPPITPLNTDPPTKGEDNSGNEVIDTRNGVRDRINLRPSGRLALRLQLPVLNDAQAISMPSGWNKTGALAPNATSIVLSMGEEPEKFRPRSQSAELITFYAGRARLPDYGDSASPELVAALAKACNKVQPMIWTIEGKTITWRTNCAEAEVADADAQFFDRNVYLLFSISGSSNSFDLKKLESQMSEAAYTSFKKEVLVAWNSAAASTVSEDTHWVPYAFGPIPLKSHGDMISHPTHGLFGIVNIVPSQWQEQTGSDSASDSPGVPVRRYLNGTTMHREFTLAIQDGLGLRDSASGLRPVDRSKSAHLAERIDGQMKKIHPNPDCPVCDDSYDFGEKAVNYRSAEMGLLLRDAGISCPQKSKSSNKLETNSDLNSCIFPSDFYTSAKTRGAVVLNACAGEEISIRVVHPGGRQRQHTFTTIGMDYDDVFPNFGFPHSALLGPGKVLTASLSRKAEVGTYAWFDGTSTLREGGVWGLLEVRNCP